MECGKDYAENKKLFVIQKIGKVKTNQSIADRIHRCVLTEISKSVRIFGKILERGNFSLIAVV